MTSTMRFDRWENPTATQSVTFDQLVGGTGLVPIVPTSIAQGASGTSSVNSSGFVTFTGTESIALSNVFTSTYRRYRVLLDVTASTVQTNLQFKLRAGTTDAATNYSYGGAQSNTAGTVGSFSGSGGTFLNLGAIGNGTSAWAHADIVLSNPATTNRTTWTQTLMWDTGTALSGGSAGGTHQVNSAYDGFRMHLGAAGTFTGTVQVFGFND